MKLGIRPLVSVASVNIFSYSQQLELNAGNAATFYFQLFDMDQDKASQGFDPAGKRYIPAAGATLAITFTNIDSAREFTRSATQPFAQDGSIWAVPLLATDPISGTVDIKGVLTESGATKSFLVHAAVECGV